MTMTLLLCVLESSRANDEISEPPPIPTAPSVEILAPHPGGSSVLYAGTRLRATRRDGTMNAVSLWKGGPDRRTPVG
jgi:hypothetical protein